MTATEPFPNAAPVLGVLVCHEGAAWLPEVLESLRRLTVRPRYLIAVDTGSVDGTAEMLARANESAPDATRLLDGVLTLPADTGFGAAVSAAHEHATAWWGDPGSWTWFVHDDSAPEPECLEVLLRVAETDPAAAVLGPVGLDWRDPRLVVDAGLSVDSSGRPQSGIGPSELDPAPSDDVLSGDPSWGGEVLAVSSACSLVRREVFERLGGFDPLLPLVGEETDLGWRVNADGRSVLCVPNARMRHVGALRAGSRAPDALSNSVRVARRAHGMRTFLVNTTPWSFLVGIARFLLLRCSRAIGSAARRRLPEAGVELTALWRLCRGKLGVLRARANRENTITRRNGARGLVTSRLTRLRNGLRGGFARMVRGRVRRDAVLGRLSLPEMPEPRCAVAETVPPDRSVGPSALSADAPAGSGRRRGVAGLRRLARPVVVSVTAPDAAAEPSPDQRPSPVPREGTQRRERLVLVPVDRRRVVREVLLAPPVVLGALLVLFAVVTHGPLAEFDRFGGVLHGGRLFAVGGPGSVWSDYLASWHPAHGGTGAPAPAALLVLALIGTLLAPVGGPAAVIAVLMLFGVPLAGMAAYAATRSLPVSRNRRAVVAAGYALLPAATMSAAHGRLGVVVAHVLLPPLLGGIASVVAPVDGAAAPRSRHWLGTACSTALGLAVLGAFAPLMHLVLLVLALLGFVLFPAGGARRGVAGLTALVLLPVACLLPWPVALLRNPEMLLHGLGAGVAERSPGAAVLALNPGGSVAAWAGALVVLAAVVALLVAPRRAALPGIVVAIVGWGTAVLVSTIPVTPIRDGPSTVGWAGAPLVLTACGLSWIVLAACSRARLPARLPRKATASALITALLVLTCGAALAGRHGPLRAGHAEATAAPRADLDEPGYLLSLRPGPRPARLLEGARPRFGTDMLAPPETVADWLRRTEADLVSGDRARVRTALAATAARGAGFVAVTEATAARLHEVAGDLVEDNGRLADGRRVLRVLLPSTPVHLLGPALAKQARHEAAPRPESGALGVAASLPEVAVRVSEGGPGRLLLLGAENAAGWQARVDGRPVPLATAWGHQVAVPLPAEAGRVRITFAGTRRAALLVAQAAVILFTVIAALPARRRRSSRS